MPVALCTVLNSWWWTERPSETCTVSCKINSLRNWCLVGFTVGIHYDARTYERQTLHYIRKRWDFRLSPRRTYEYITILRSRIVARRQLVEIHRRFVTSCRSHHLGSLGQMVWINVLGLGVGGVKLFREVSAPIRWPERGRVKGGRRGVEEENSLQCRELIHFFEMRHSTFSDRTEERFSCPTQNQSVLSVHAKGEFQPTHLP
jgi:hypothetical protein